MREINRTSLNLFCILRDLFRNAWVIVLLTAAAWMGTSVVLQSAYTPVYTSNVTYFVSPKDSTASAYANMITGGRMAEALSTVFESSIMAQNAAESLGLTSLDAEVSARAVANTNLLQLKVTSTSPEHTFRVIRAIMEHHPSVSQFVFDNAVVEILDSPSMPSSASNHVPLRSTQKKASLAAAAVTAVAIVIFSILRDTVKTPEAMDRLIDAKSFGVLPYEVKNKTWRAKIKRKTSAVLLSDPLISYHYANALKRLATKLEYAAKLRGLKSILISSAGENEGKSTIAVNVAWSLAQRGYRVLLMEGDLRKPALHKLLERAKTNYPDFTDYLRGQLPLDQALIHDEENHLQLLLCRKSVSDSAELVDSARMREAIAQLKEQVDFIIIDSPPLLMAADSEVLAASCDAALLTVSQDRSRVAMINDSVDKLVENTTVLGCIFNNARSWSPTTLFESRRYAGYYKNA